MEYASILTIQDCVKNIGTCVNKNLGDMRMFLKENTRGPWENLARFNKQAKEIEFVWINVTFYEGLSINMMPCLNTC